MRKDVFILSAILMMLAGCEKVVMDGDTVDEVGDGGTLMLSVNISGTRGGGTSLVDACTRLNVAVFDESGQKVKTVSQAAGDSEYGVVRLSLDEGLYTFVAIGHNSTGSATITSTEKVTFPNNKVTDTFYYYGDIDVTGGSQQESVVLTRAVAMLRMIIGDDGSGDVASLKFYYTGGSSTFSPSSGFGCVNSKQTEYRVWNEEGIYELYTMPHSWQDELTRLTVTTYDSGDNVIGEWTLEHIPVTLNRVTEYAGDLSGGAGSGSWATGMTVDVEWDGIDEYTF